MLHSPYYAACIQTNSHFDIVSKQNRLLSVSTERRRFTLRCKVETVSINTRPTNAMLFHHGTRDRILPALLVLTHEEWVSASWMFQHLRGAFLYSIEHIIAEGNATVKNFCSDFKRVCIRGRQERQNSEFGTQFTGASKPSNATSRCIPVFLLSNRWNCGITRQWEC